MDELDAIYEHEMIDFPANQKRIRCVAHSINLAVQAALKSISPSQQQQQEQSNEEEDVDADDDQYDLNIPVADPVDSNVSPADAPSVSIALTKVKKKDGRFDVQFAYFSSN